MESTLPLPSFTEGLATGRRSARPAGADTPHFPREDAPPPSYAEALAASRPVGWDPREVWLNRVHRPRAGRRSA